MIIRMLCITALLAAGLTAVATAAGAAVPNRWGFAHVNVNNGVPDIARQAGSWPAGPTVTVTPGGIGQTYVRFPQIGIPRGGIVHVTAISQEAVWCQVQKWGQSGADEIVVVQCYRYGGAAVFTPYSIVFSESSGRMAPPGAFGYIHWTGSAIGSTYNSSGVANNVGPTGVGVWTVTLPGLGSSTIAGNIQVTAVNPSVPARCKVSAWAPIAAAQQIQVRCHNATNVPLNTGWNLTYQRERAITGGVNPPRNFAYVFDNSPANPGPYTPVPPAITFNSQGSFNDIMSAGLGFRLVSFYQVGALPDNVQVTAFGTGPEFCNLLTLWNTFGVDVRVRDVVCYNAVTRVNQPSFTTYVSAR
ncbi:hypothetical protein [Sphaerisporangium sp. TRM90804]|uniref:hypothetical protein n=1 Tax=Sphaerisporangium sp. TRM90804 TaxID=3031113 RepID=UPI00244CAB12|nr:hypothetical protein [Sphaerisporangium sp. TRM90804]MDH2425265.1 hypothetical protein [Sphaerisporangium sp. TRM90804]